MKLVLFFLTFLSLGLTVEAGLPDLKKWEGKYPKNQDPQFKNFFELPEVKPALRKMLSPAERKRLTHTYAVMTPILLIRDHLVVEVCLPHDCPVENAMLVIDLSKRRFYVGFYYDRRNVTIKWICSDGDFQELPKEIQDEFYYRHNPK